MNGISRNAKTRKISAFSDLAATGRLSPVDEIGTEVGELVDEVLVAAADDPDVAHCRLAVCGERSDEVTESATEVGDLHVCSVQRGRTDDDGGLLERAARHATADRLKTVFVHNDVGTHL